MISLTTKELIILSAIIILGFIILGSIFKTLFRVMLAIAATIVLFSIGFFWLPNKVEQIRAGETTPGEVITNADRNRQEMAESVKQGVDYIDENKQGWIEAFDSLYGKLNNLRKEEKAEEH